MKKSHLVAGVAFIALLVAGLFLIFSDRGPSGGDAAVNAAGASRMSEAELIAANREPPPAAAPAELRPPGPPALTPAWLAGTWAPAENNPANDPTAPCETDVIVTFRADGRYEQGDGSFGRFRINRDQITYFDRVIRELGSDEEDRSEFDQSTTARIVPINQNEMRVEGEAMRRCRSG